MIPSFTYTFRPTLIRSRLTRWCLVLLGLALLKPARAAAPGEWVNVTPSNANITFLYGGDSFGTTSIAVDPRRPAHVYAVFNNQGIWKSTDYGQTWTGPINTGANGFNSTGAGSFAIADGGPSNPPILYVANIRGGITGGERTIDGLGFWRSLDGGVNWSKHTVTPTPTRQDYYPPNVDPYDSQHLLMAGHEMDVLVESTDGGQTWTDIPIPDSMKVGGGSAFVFFINTGNPASTRATWLFIPQGGDRIGTWRTANAGTDWVRVDKNEHVHGPCKIYQPGNGVVYMAGVYSTLGWGVLRSTDYGQTWQHYGSYGNEALMFGTSNKVYSAYSWAQGAGTIPMNLQIADQPGTGTWASVTTPAEMYQGPADVAVTNDGTNNIIVTANWITGLWRYVEPAATSTAPVTVIASPGTHSLSAGANRQFTASITGTNNLNVTWSVLESGGGTINASGVYFAPSTAGTYHVKATSVADSSKSATATITVTSSTSASTAMPAITMPLISRNVPAFASSVLSVGNASSANDNNYQSLWFSTTNPSWIAYDLSSVPVGQRQQILVAWYAGRSLGYINPLPNEFIQIPIDYTIETNSAPGGTNTAPTSGWQAAVTVTGNNRGSRQHLISLAGANWVRLRATASSSPDGVAIDLDIHSAPAGASDAWLFMGDSITGFAAYLFSDLPGRVNALAPERWPVIVPAAIGGSNEGSANDVIDTCLATFPGRFVTLNYGTNGGGPGFTAAMEILIQKVIAAGKTPVIPHMPWSDIPDQLAKAPSVNAQIDALYLKYPAILPGPDLYEGFRNRTDLIPSGDVHPNGPGNEEMRRLWAQTIATAGATIIAPNSAVITITVSN